MNCFLLRLLCFGLLVVACDKRESLQLATPVCGKDQENTGKLDERGSVCVARASLGAPSAKGVRMLSPVRRQMSDYRPVGDGVWCAELGQISTGTPKGQEDYESALAREIYRQGRDIDLERMGVFPGTCAHHGGLPFQNVEIDGKQIRCALIDPSFVDGDPMHMEVAAGKSVNQAVRRMGDCAGGDTVPDFVPPQYERHDVSPYYAAFTNGDDTILWDLLTKRFYNYPGYELARLLWDMRGF